MKNGGNNFLEAKLRNTPISEMCDDCMIQQISWRLLVCHITRRAGVKIR